MRRQTQGKDARREHVVGSIRDCVGKRGGTTGVLNQRASEEGERERDPGTHDRRYTGTRPFDTEDTNRHQHRETRTNVYIYI